MNNVAELSSDRTSDNGVQVGTIASNRELESFASFLLSLTTTPTRASEFHFQVTFLVALSSSLLKVPLAKQNEHELSKFTRKFYVPSKGQNQYERE